MDSCCKKKDILVIYGQVLKTKTCCCTQPQCGDPNTCECDYTGQVTYINGNLLSKKPNSLGIAVDTKVGSWNSIRTIINDEPDHYISEVRDIWRFSLTDSIFTITELVVDKKTKKSVFLNGFVLNGTGKYLNCKGSYNLSLVDNSKIKAELNIY